MVPGFTSAGLLPPGDYSLTLAELRASLLVIGPGGTRRWDDQWRLHLVENLAILAAQLWRVGVQDIYINGSFVEDKAHPNDIDGYFTCNLYALATGKLESELAKLDDIWTWDDQQRLPDRNSTKRQLPMWHKYRVELYPESSDPSGIVNQFGLHLPFSQAFRQRRSTYEPKGLVRLVRTP